jgi:PAS domain S-box-containing protein
MAMARLAVIEDAAVPKRGKPDPARAVSSSIAWKVALIFLLIGVTWVVATDLLLYHTVSDPVVIARLETAKGWAFVALGMVILYVVTRRVVRRLARSRAAMQALMKSISDGLLVMDPNGKIVYANPAAARMLGVDSQQLIGVGAEEFGRRFQLMLPNGSREDPNHFAALRALRGENPPTYKVVMHPERRGELITMITGAPVRPVPTGPVAFALSVMNDVTAIEQLHRMRDEFVSSAAHTLKTPVTIISAQAQLLASERVPLAKCAESIEHQCRRIARITENLLVLTRLRTESLQLEPTFFHLVDAVLDAVAEMKTASVEHTLSVRTSGHPIVFGDKRLLTLVFENGIDTVFRHAAPQTEVVVDVDQVGDTGRVKAIFTPLQPLSLVAEQAADASIGELGLQRYLMAHLVRLNGGRLGTDAEDGHRAAWIEIPTVEGRHD